MGAILLPGGCCCIPAGAVCNCNSPSCDVTPLQFRVTFSDVVLCPDCYNRYSSGHTGPSVAWKTMPTVLPDGSFIVTQDSPFTPCAFSCTVNADGEWEAYQGRDCTGGVVWKEEMDELYVELDIICSTPPTVRIEVSYLPFGVLASVFYGKTATTKLCDRGEATVVNNTHVCAYQIMSTIWQRAGSGGTATVVPLI